MVFTFHTILIYIKKMFDELKHTISNHSLDDVHTGTLATIGTPQKREIVQRFLRNEDFQSFTGERLFFSYVQTIFDVYMHYSIVLRVYILYIIMSSVNIHILLALCLFDRYSQLCMLK